MIVLNLLAVMVLAAGCGRSQGVAIPLNTSNMPTAVPATAAPEEAAAREATADAPPAEAAVEQPVEAEQPAEGGSVEAAPVEVEPTITPTPWMGDWRAEPVVPTGVSQTAIDIYQRGLEMGTDPHSFSVIGDCQNINAPAESTEGGYEFFLGGFGNPNRYNLGEYTYLQGVIDNFSVTNSFSRKRIAVNPGFNVAGALSPLWTDTEFTPCDARESPLECEFRVNNPSIVIISMETWWYERPAETYAGYLRQIVEFSIEHGAVPILSTKADNLEGDYSLNNAVVQVAKRYDVPLWNFWAATDPLPDHGLRDDDFHLTYQGPYCHFQDEENLQYGWPVRNLTALQTLDVVWRGVSGN
jgi:hypothetical protein